MTPLINLLQINFSLPTKNTKSIIRNRIRDNNLFSFFAKSFYSNIMSEYNYTTELKGIIQDQIKNLRKTPTPQLPNFDDAAASVLDVIDWIFKMASFVSQMNILYSEMITLLQHSSCIGHLWYFMRFLFTLLLHGTLAPTLFLLQFCFTDQRTVR